MLAGIEITCRSYENSDGWASPAGFPDQEFAFLASSPEMLMPQVKRPHSETHRAAQIEGNVSHVCILITIVFKIYL